MGIRKFMSKLENIPTSTRGRPRKIRNLAESLIGTAGFAALQAADLHIVSGEILREFTLLVGEAVPAKPEIEASDE